MELSETTTENSTETSEKGKKCGWVKYSEETLISVEKKIFEVLQTSYKGWHVPIDHNSDEKTKIWTIGLNLESKNVPLVLLHGFGAAVGFWCLNLDALSKNRPVYAIDILGFGRSSRPNFSKHHLKAEQQIVESIEKWRKEVKLEQFILLGHSMGGYLSASYTIKYPKQVKHLILADPWGFVATPAPTDPPLWFKTLRIVLYPFTALNPLATVRAAGPLGPWVIKKVRSDIAMKYADDLDDYEIISDYIYHCNAQKPTGETAFHNMLTGFSNPKSPMIERIDNLDEEIPITVLNGSHTWMDRTIGEKLKKLRPTSYVQMAIIDNAGHHIHADNPDSFNRHVYEACLRADSLDNEKSEQLPETEVSEEGA